MIPIRDNIYCKTVPYVSWAIMAICIVIFVLMQIIPYETQRQIIYLYGMVPIRYSNPEWSASFGLPADYFLSFFTSLFLHGGWIHLIVNMWFMWIFAKNIEDKMGHIRFLFFYVICGLIATYAQWYFDQELAIPVVGASGAIAGVLGAYFFISPNARIVIWLPLLFLPIFFELPAIAFLGFWVIIQIPKATSVLMFEDVIAEAAWWAHLGGFIAGSILYGFFMKNNEQEDKKNKEE